MSLLPLFNYIENTTKQSVNLQRKLQQVTAEIVLKDELESRHKGLKGFLHQHLMEYYTLEMLTQQYEAQQAYGLSLHRLAQQAYISFWKVNEQMKRFDFNKMLGFDVQAQDMQLQRVITEMELEHEKEALVVEKMKNREILQIRLQRQTRNTASLHHLKQIKDNLQKSSLEDEQKIQSLKQQHNLEIINFIRLLKELEHFKQELHNHQCKQGNLEALTKKKDYLTKRLSDLRNSQTDIKGFLNISQTIKNNPPTAKQHPTLPPFAVSFAQQISHDLFKRPTLKEHFANYQANKTHEKPTAIKPILKGGSSQEKQFVMPSPICTQEKRVHFQLPESPVNDHPKSIDAFKELPKEQQTEKKKAIEPEDVIDLVTQTQVILTSNVDVTEGKIVAKESCSVNLAGEDVRKQQKASVEILECVKLNVPMFTEEPTKKSPNGRGIAAINNNAFEESFKEPAKPSSKPSQVARFYEELTHCSSDAIASTDSDIASVEQPSNPNETKSKPSDNSRDFEKFLLMNAIDDDTDDNESVHGGNQNPLTTRNYAATEDLFFDSASMRNNVIDNIAEEDNSLFDLSDCEMGANKKNTDFF